MNIQYRFQLVFLRLTLKRNVLSDSNLKITLLKAKKQQLPVALETEEIKIKKNQKLIDLDSIKTFVFNANNENQDNIFTIKYEIKGNGEDRVRTIPININKMIQDFQNTKKGVFQQAFGGESAQISYKFYLSPLQNQNLNANAQNREESASHGDQTKLVNSINRSKRPPGLNLQKRASKSPKPFNQPQAQHPQKRQIKQFLSQGIGPQLMSPISPQITKKTFIKLNSVDHDQFNSSISGVQNKKISSLPLSQIEKVNELMNTHHRPHSQFHHQSFHLSYKLKIVIIMLVIGIAFLLFDTLSDRKSKKVKKMEQHNQHGDGHHQDPHADPHHHQQKPKKAKGKHEKPDSHAKTIKETTKQGKKKIVKQVKKQKKH